MRNPSRLPKRAPASIAAIASAALSLSLLGGCAVSPLVSWEPPKKVEGPPMVQDYARGYSDAARSAYQRAIRDQVQASGELSNGLIVAGAVALGLAAGHVHRDAIVGTALAGGTAYALGSWNLDKRRLVIYQAGVDAFNCASRAVSPLDMRQADFDALGVQLAELEAALKDANAAIADADAKVDAFGQTSGPAFQEAGPLKDRIKATGAVVALGNQTIAPGRQLQGNVGASGTRLKEAVDRIDASIVKALLDTLPDLSSVTKVIASLSGFAGAIAPGAGIDALLGQSLANVQAKSGLTIQSDTTPPPIPPGVTQALGTMDAAVARVATSTRIVQGYLASHDAALHADALADCGLGDVSFPLTPTPALVNVDPGGAPQFVVINGGTPPFEVRQSGSGLVLTGPVKLERSFQVAAAASAAAGTNLNLLITDSSNPVKSQTLGVAVGKAPESKPVPAVAAVRAAPRTVRPASVAAARTPTPTTATPASTPTPTAGPATPSSPSPPPTAATSAAPASVPPVAASKPEAVLDLTGPFRMPNKSLISMGGRTTVAADGSITVTLSCRPSPDVPPPACIARDALLQAFKTQVGAALDAATLARVGIVTRPANCQCPG